MKKSLLFALAAIVALGAQAIQLKDAKTLNAPMKNQHMTLSQRAQSGNATLVAAPAKKVSIMEEPVSEAPEGTEYKNLYVTGDSYGLGYGDIYYQPVDGGVSSVVEGADGNLYIRGPISQAFIWMLGTPYIKCTPNGDGTYTMATPQLYALDAGDPYYIQRLKYDAELEIYVVDEANTTVKFKWENNVLTQLDDCYFGLTDATGEWFYMADNNVKMVENTDVVATVPAGATVQDASFVYKYSPTKTDAKTRMISLHQADGTYYLTAMEDNLEESAIVMYQGDGNYNIPSCQYLGVDEIDYNAHVYVLAGNAKVDDGTSYYNYDLTDMTLFAEQDGSFVSQFPASLVMNCGRNNLYIIDDFVAPVITPVADEALVPANPSIVEVKHYSSFDNVKFNLPLTSVDGKSLNSRYLSYCIYYNDNVYTFTPEEFVGLTENMTEFPYNFADSNYDIFFSESSGNHTLYFYDKNYDKLGVQSIYRGGNEENRSEVVYYSKKPSGIDGVNVENAGKVRKYIVDGQFIIEKDGVKYNVTGQAIK